MKIVVFLSGSIKNGLDSPTPGEGRFGQNLAKMLIERGHEVDCVAGHRSNIPSWGNTTPPPNATLNWIPNSNKEYDLALYVPWEHQYNPNNPYQMIPWQGCLNIPIKSKYYAHCTFSWSDSIRDDHTCYNNNHILVFPYVQDDFNFPTDKKENPYPTFPLPLPIYRELAPVNTMDRKNVLWSTKDVFHPDWGDLNHHVPRIGLATLNSIKKLREEFEFESHFLSTRFFDPEKSWIGKELKVREVVNSIPGSHMHELLPRNELMDIMKTCRITTIVSGLLGSFGESIAMGSVPLCYSGHLYRKSADKHNIKLDVFNATEEEIYSCIRKLYVDDNFYEEVLKDYREEISYYSYETSYEYFLNMINELGLKEYP